MTQRTANLAHLGAIFFALVLTALGLYVVIENVKGITMAHLIAGGACLVLALALAIPAQLQQATAALAPLAGYVPFLRQPTAQPQASAAPDVARDDGGAK